MCVPHNTRVHACVFVGALRLVVHNATRKHAVGSDLGAGEETAVRRGVIRFLVLVGLYRD